MTESLKVREWGEYYATIQHVFIVSLILIKKVIRNRNYGINKDEVGVSWMKEKSLAFRGVSEGTDVVKIDFGVNDERGH